MTAFRPEFTQEEYSRQQIVAFTKSCCVSAGAGAGKTTCMVQAYLNLLAEGMSPDNIVVITFTEKAAIELKQRIIKELKQDKNEFSNNKQIGNIQFAPISTVHSFCARLLREYGFYLGLNHDFAVLDANEFHQLTHDVLENFLRQGLKHRWPELAFLMSEYRLPSIKRMLVQLLQASYVNGLTIIDMNRQTRAALESPPAHKFVISDQLKQSIRELAEQFCKLPPSQKNTQYALRIQSLLTAWSEYQRNGKADFFKELKNYLQGNWRQFREYKIQLDKYVKELIQIDLSQQSIPWLNNLLKLAEKAGWEIENELMARSALSFDHLLLKTNELFLPQYGLKKHLQENFPVMMVDEFQDINQVQADLIMHLAGLNSDGLTDNKLMIVGDRKQSIYGFRGANIELFSDIKDIFAKNDLGTNITINNNYRSTPSLIKFFNYLFPNYVFRQPDGTKSKYRFQICYDEYDKQQSAINGNSVIDEIDHYTDVEIWDCRREEKKLSQQRLAEAESIAGNLEKMLNNDCHPGDIVLLFRNLNNISYYETALAEAAIPYYVEQGKNFYQQREIKDLALGLACLQQSNDSISWAGLLLSRIFGISLEGLWNLLQFNGSDNLLQALQKSASESSLPHLDANDTWVWSKFCNFYNGINKLSHRLQPAELIRALLEDTPWQTRLAGSRHGGQKIANLRKLLEDSRHNPHCYDGDFINRLGQLGREPLAPLLSQNTDFVRLMTIHQAKGLEFPIVILPDLDASLPHPITEKLFISSQGEVSLRRSTDWGSKKIYDYLFEKQRHEHNLKENAESSRIFYVACTRASKKLIFCLSSIKTQDKSWSKWVSELLDNPMLKVHTAEQDKIRCFSPSDNQPVITPTEDDYLNARQIISNCQPIQYNSLYVRTSVSTMEEWLQCPRRGWMQQNWNIDWADLPSKNNKIHKLTAINDDNKLKARVIGNYIHKIMELTDFNKPLNEVFNIISSFNLTDEYESTLKSIIRRWRQTPWPALWGQYSQLYREIPFNLMLSAKDFSLELRGAIDLLACAPNKPTMIIDYKVSKPNWKKYEAQMACYALAWQKSDPRNDPPQIKMCFLGSDKINILEKYFTTEELASWEIRLINAAMTMAQYDNDFSALPYPQKCDPKCQLYSLCNLSSGHD
ncbi:MAG: UvrD-helicase domain-containing protein [Desulfarculales bacterium]|jgi:ATP-dependent helicase/nuclease subunit A|nr:UvrD-helicase domain-containing protein [Desulfarculales bacterium]